MHEHNQDHKHGEALDHEHSHEHLHEHEHTQGHSHDHSPSNHSHPNTKGELQLTEHEGAFVASLARDVAGSFEDISKALAEGLAELAGWVSENGGAVGHIKASLTDGATTATFSTTGGAVSVTTFPNPDPAAPPKASDPCHAEVAVIVLGVDTKAFEPVVNTVLSSVLTPA